MDSNLVDISAGAVSLVGTVLFLRVWQPKRVWRFSDEGAVFKTCLQKTANANVTLAE
jgi:L-lactate permease